MVGYPETDPLPRAGHRIAVAILKLFLFAMTNDQ